MRGAGISAIGLALLLCALAAQAQAPAWAIGKWHGFLENYPGKEGADRFMTVSPSGACTWSSPLATEPMGAQSCTISGDMLILVTANKSQVTLKFKGDRLEGTFQTSAGNRNFMITMTRE